VVGPSDCLLIDPAARIDPLVVCNTTGGPVVIDRDAVVTSFTCLEGPCYIGPGTHVLGAKVRAGTSLGPMCRVGGEVEASILLGHANKYHDGFLGHAYVGEWVNLGAGTSNSDLRNDYGEVSVIFDGRAVRTGRSKVGCFLGDHTKTGLGTLLNTGASAGAFCNLLPCAGLLPKYAPPFTSVWNGSLRDNTDLPGLLRTAETVMARRGQTLTEAYRAMVATLLERTTAERRLAIRDAEARRLRRSA
jgi:UDP-N-acetylglucosamine diphosphorylase/glucosamine-1-phosphate N-acetyltransferase